ncbi:MAG: hypothetical protein SFU99_24165 [Saprospiraceae bacterium]|nr:hypothetical protein [Saprospiraceae bacterium]
MNRTVEATHVSDYEIHEYVRKTATVEVLFGLSSKNCAGMGICRIDKLDFLDIQMNTGHKCRSVIARMILTKQQSVRLHIPATKICQKRMNGLFMGDELMVRETFRIPSDLAYDWGLKGHYVPAGHYPLVRTESWVIIAFSCFS